MKKNKSIKIAIIGVGNCASSLIQGISFYLNPENYNLGIMHWEIAGYKPVDIEVVAAFDIDERKVGKPLNQAIFSEPNNTQVFCKDLRPSNVIVAMGKVLDGVAEHFANYEDREAFRVSNLPEADFKKTVEILCNSGAEILVNYLPVGSKLATNFYMECALEAGLGVVNCIPCFIASDPYWQQKFKARGLPIIGDDIKSQLGATVIHRTLTSLFEDRGVNIDSSYQLNVGGNTDFLNMLEDSRLKSKKISKTSAVSSLLKKNKIKNNLHIGPSGYVPWLKDNKVCFLRMEGRIFGNVPMNLELRLSVEDSPNSSGSVIDAIRCCKVAMNNKQAGSIDGVSSYLMKHPPKQFCEETARQMLEDFITDCDDIIIKKRNNMKS